MATLEIVGEFLQLLAAVQNFGPWVSRFAPSGSKSKKGHNLEQSGTNNDIFLHIFHSRNKPKVFARQYNQTHILAGIQEL